MESHLGMEKMDYLWNFALIINGIMNRLNRMMCILFICKTQSWLWIVWNDDHTRYRIDRLNPFIMRNRDMLKPFIKRKMDSQFIVSINDWLIHCTVSSPWSDAIVDAETEELAAFSSVFIWIDATIFKRKLRAVTVHLIDRLDLFTDRLNCLAEVSSSQEDDDDKTQYMRLFDFPSSIILRKF